MARASRSGVIGSHRSYSRGQGERGYAIHYDARAPGGNLTRPAHPIFTIILSGISSWNRWAERTAWRRTRKR